MISRPWTRAAYHLQGNNCSLQCGKRVSEECIIFMSLFFFKLKMEILIKFSSENRSYITEKKFCLQPHQSLLALFPLPIQLIHSKSIHWYSFPTQQIKAQRHFKQPPLNKWAKLQVVLSFPQKTSIIYIYISVSHLSVSISHFFTVLVSSTQKKKKGFEIVCD